MVAWCVLICYGTAAWKRGRRELITAAQRLCSRLAKGKKHIREELWDIYISSGDIEIQLHISVMCDGIPRPARVCVCLCVLTLVCLNGLELNLNGACVCMCLSLHPRVLQGTLRHGVAGSTLSGTLGKPSHLMFSA